MKRFSEQYLVQWIKTRRRKPLILRGARQVGKSTLVRQFANQQNLLLNEINLERHLELDKVFATLDIAVIRGELEALVGRSITEPGSLLFLDEIQATPSAIQALRYFYEDLPDIPVIAAGSLLEFTLADHSFSMPVGRIEYHHLGPMTFREFLIACHHICDLCTPAHVGHKIDYKKAGYKSWSRFHNQIERDIGRFSRRIWLKMTRPKIVEISSEYFWNIAQETYDNTFVRLESLYPVKDQQQLIDMASVVISAGVKHTCDVWHTILHKTKMTTKKWSFQPLL